MSKAEPNVRCWHQNRTNCVEAKSCSIRSPCRHVPRIPVGLPDAQQLLAEKDLNGRVMTTEIIPVLFSLLEGFDKPAFRVS